MYFVESSILLDANVFDERQENTKPIVTRFVVPWILRFCFFSLFYTYLELKSMHYSTSFCRNKDSQPEKKKEKKEEKRL